MQEFQPFAGDLDLQQRQPGDITARSRQTGNEFVSNRVPATAKTIGIVDVACFTTATIGVPDVTITSTLRRTNSAAISWARSGRPSALRSSMVIVRPPIQPS